VPKPPSASAAPAVPTPSNAAPGAPGARRRQTTPESKRLCALRQVDGAKFAAQVRGALVTEQGNVAGAARVLRVSTRQLWRWIDENPSLLNGTGHQSRRAEEGLEEKERDSLDT